MSGCFVGSTTQVVTTAGEIRLSHVSSRGSYAMATFLGARRRFRAFFFMPGV
jgi:hypothetical protein